MQILYYCTNILSICFMYSSTFAIIETIFRQLSNYLCGSNDYGYTTLTQYALTFAWTPLFILHKNIGNSILRIFLFPVNVYSCELIGGSLIWYFFGYRVWCYYGYFAMFNGFITLSYLPYWIALGLIEDYVYHRYLIKLNN